MKKLNGIIESSNPPEDTNLLWKKGEKLYTFNNGEWHDIDNDTKPMLNISEKQVPKTIINLKEDGTPYIGHFDEETGILYGPTTVEVAEGEYGGECGDLTPEIKGIWVKGSGITTTIPLENISKDCISFTGDKYIFYPSEPMEYPPSADVLEVFCNSDIYVFFGGTRTFDEGLFDEPEQIRFPLGFLRAFHDKQNDYGNSYVGVHFNKILVRRTTFMDDAEFHDYLYEYSRKFDGYVRVDTDIRKEIFYTEGSDTSIWITRWDRQFDTTYIPNIVVNSNVRKFDQEFSLGIQEPDFNFGPPTIQLRFDPDYLDVDLTIKLEATNSWSPTLKSQFNLTHDPDLGSKYYYYKEDSGKINITYLVFKSGGFLYIKRILPSTIGYLDCQCIILPYQFYKLTEDALEQAITAGKTDAYITIQRKQYPQILEALTFYNDLAGVYQFYYSPNLWIAYYDGTGFDTCESSQRAERAETGYIHSGKLAERRYYFLIDGDNLGVEVHKI